MKEYHYPFYLFWVLGFSGITVMLWMYLWDLPYSVSVMIVFPWHIYMSVQSGKAMTHDRDIHMRNAANHQKLVNLITGGRRNAP